MHIEHVALNVRDLEAAKDFFCKYFRAEAATPYHNPRTGLRSYFLTFPDGGARLELMTWPAMPAEGFAPDADGRLRQQLHALGYTHLCLSVGSHKAVDEMTARLLADGYRHVSGPRTTGEGYYESCILLEDGVELELTD
ncbi:MAG: VOC family protein [Bacteroidaceae bacterium]|nr:VOC family protein [Bacteroidaceae bacterium]